MTTPVQAFDESFSLERMHFSAWLVRTRSTAVSGRPDMRIWESQQQLHDLGGNSAQFVHFLLGAGNAGLPREVISSLATESVAAGVAIGIS